MSAVRRLTAAAIVVAGMGAIAPSSALAAAPTIDSFNVHSNGGTFAECDNLSVQHTDRAPDVSGSGAFSASQTIAPADSTASCTAGSGTDHTAGSASSTGAVDSNQVLRLSDTVQGSTTTSSTFTGDPNSDCIDVGDGIAAQHTVQFTITDPTPFSYTGTFSTSGHQANGFGVIGYSLSKTSAPTATIFDINQGMSPNIKGTLQPGTYQYGVSGHASNDLACTESGTETDSYSYSVRLLVGTVAPPVNTAPPAISGTPAVAQTLTCSNGSWDNNPTSFAYQWNQDGAPIPGATSQTYVVQPGDQGHTLTCTVTAHNDGGETPTTSAGVAIPPPPAGVPVNSAPPAISGTPSVGDPLACSNGSWTNNPTGFAFRWNRDGTAIPGATGATYVVQAADRGHDLTCTVTASNSSGPGSPSTSGRVPVAAVPRCTLTAGSKVTVVRRRGKVARGTVRVSVRCDQTAGVKLTAVLTDAPAKHHGHKPPAKHFRLPAINATVGAGRTAVLKLSLPAAAVTDLQHHAKESLAISLTASNANGTSQASAHVGPLTI